jgi:hypothetical protein
LIFTALVARFEKISQDEEAALLKRLMESGWEAGCWLRPPPEQIPTAT